MILNSVSWCKPSNIGSTIWLITCLVYILIQRHWSNWINGNNKNSRSAGWSTFLQQFSFVIKHWSGFRRWSFRCSNPKGDSAEFYGAKCLFLKSWRNCMMAIPIPIYMQRICLPSTPTWVFMVGINSTVNSCVYQPLPSHLDEISCFCGGLDSIGHSFKTTVCILSKQFQGNVVADRFSKMDYHIISQLRLHSRINFVW